MKGIIMRQKKEHLDVEIMQPEKDPAMKPPIDWRVKTDASKVDEYLYAED